MFKCVDIGKFFDSSLSVLIALEHQQGGNSNNEEAVDEDGRGRGRIGALVSGDLGAGEADGLAVGGLDVVGLGAAAEGEAGGGSAGGLDVIAVDDDEVGGREAEELGEAEEVVEGSGIDGGTVDAIEDGADAVGKADEGDGAEVGDSVGSILDAGREGNDRVSVLDILDKGVDGVLALVGAETRGAALGDNILGLGAENVGVSSDALGGEVGGACLRGDRLEEGQGVGGSGAGAEAAGRLNGSINGLRASDAFIRVGVEVSQLFTGLGEGDPLRVEVGSTLAGARGGVLAEEVGGSGGAMGGGSGLSARNRVLAFRAALEAIGVGAVIVDLVDVGDGDLGAGLTRANELAAGLIDRTEALNIGIIVSGGEASEKLLVIPGQGVSASIGADALGSGTLGQDTVKKRKERGGVSAKNTGRDNENKKKR